MSFDPEDTIVAPATPPGRGAIGVVRLSGPAAAAIAAALTSRRAEFEPRRATLARITPPAGVQSASPIDQVLVTWFPQPHSYTGQDTIEISAHGSPAVLRAIVEGAIALGARPARPGEFTLRAYLNGRLDLAQAEAVADLVDAVTPLQARAACDQLQGTLSEAIRELDQALLDLVARTEASLDFPEEGYHFIDPAMLAGEVNRIASRVAALVSDGRRGRLVREGFSAALVGRPNTGKSSLFNALLGRARAIVTPQPGTTRDLLAETVDLHGYCVTLVDTAGRRVAADPAEEEGVRRALAAAEASDVTIAVLDRSRSLTAEDRELVAAVPASRLVVAANKDDLPAAWEPAAIEREVVPVSALTGEGLDRLVQRLLAVLDAEDPGAEPPHVTSARHVALLERAGAALSRAADSAGGGLPEEFVLADLHEARAALGEITGRHGGDEVLAEIFARFCIGK